MLVIRSKLNKGLILGLLFFAVMMLTACSKDESSNSNGITAKIDGDIQRVTSEVTSSGYEAIRVQKGIPVEWTIKVADGVLTSCNNKIVIQKYGIEKKLSVGDNIVEFTPSESGSIPYSCWMGMIGNEINVNDK